MAEFQRMPTQEELQKILYMGQMQGKTTQEIINENLAKGGTVKPLPENFFTTASAGAKRAGDYINKAGTAADVAKLFPGYQPETKVTIPTSFSVVPKMDPYSGQVMPTGLQTQQAPIGNVLQQIKPSDISGVSGAERTYGDVGAGKAPQLMDVVDTLGLGAGGMAAGKGLLTAGAKTARYAAPVVGEALEGYAANTGLLAPLITYHGSPHSFDKFDIAKVGTGEGNQAFGHGMYFAENKDIAKSYVPNFSERQAEARMFGSKDIDDAIRKAREELDYVTRNKAPTATVNEVRQEIAQLELKKSGKGGSGALYKVDIPDRSIAKMVDYDEPIKNQHKAVKDFAIKQGLLLDDLGFDLIQKVGRDKAGSDAMRAAGITGIKYIDQMNRVGGKETKNYVVFDPSRLKILEKNDTPVSSLTTIYHGTTPQAAKAIEKSGFDINKSADGTIWFTSNPNIGEVAASGKGGVVKRMMDTSKMKLGGWEQADKYSTNELMNMGYDGLMLKDKSGITYQIFNPEKLKK
jgi:hypothetical protein